MAKRKCPHGKPTTIVSIQVTKLGAWEGKGPWALMIDVFRGGSIGIAQGTKREMETVKRLCLLELENNWNPARSVADVCRSVVPDRFREAAV